MQAGRGYRADGPGNMTPESGIKTGKSIGILIPTTMTTQTKLKLSHCHYCLFTLFLKNTLTGYSYFKQANYFLISFFLSTDWIC